MTDEDNVAAIETQRECIFALGTLVVRWNQADDALRTLLMSLCGSGMSGSNLRTEAIALELGTRGVTQALQTIANDELPLPESDLVLHAVKYYEILGEYRNFYVHTIKLVTPNGATTTHKSAKGKLLIGGETIQKDNLVQVYNWANELSQFITQLNFSMFFPLGERTPLPEKPALPDRLQKIRVHRSLPPNQRPAWQR
jgi:hypothetical protein